MVDGITAHSGDGIVLWLDVYSTGETFVPAIEMSILEIEGRVSDLREFYPDITYIVAGGVPFICYTAPGEGGEYLMAYTWTASLQINFVFRAPELTDEVRAAIFQILDTYRAL